MKTEKDIETTDHSTNGNGTAAGRAAKRGAARLGAPKGGAMIITLPKLNLSTMEVILIGDSPLIVHKWSEKAKTQIRDKQAKKAKTAREARDPAQEYRDSLYIDDQGEYVFPSIAFKNSAVDACSHVEGITKVLARGAFHVVGEFVKISTREVPKMREDTVKIGMGVGDLRYRGEFTEWAAKLTVRYNANVLSAEQVLNLFSTAGFAVGVGEWRPEKNGQMGMYRVATSAAEFKPFDVKSPKISTVKASTTRKRKSAE